MCSHNQHNKPDNLAGDIRDATGEIRNVVDRLHDIAQGDFPRANTHNRIRATRILLDRGFGKAPRRPCSDSTPSNHNHRPTPAKDNPTPVGPSHHGGSTVSGTVTQIDDSLHDSLKSELVSYTQEYIHTVTDDGRTLITVLTGILDADPDDLAVKPCHRIDAAQILLDRALGVDCDPPEDPADEIPPEDIRGTPEWVEAGQRELNAHIQKIIDSATEEDWRRGAEATEEEIEEIKARAYRALLAANGDPRAHSGGYIGKFDDP